MIKVQRLITALAMMLALLMLQGCSSMELAIDFYKKQKILIFSFDSRSIPGVPGPILGPLGGPGGPKNYQKNP